VALIAVLAPLTWYLASPLFIRVELQEPAPALAADPEPTSAPPTSTPVSSTADDPRSTTTPADVPATPAADPIPASTPVPIALDGRFRGADDFHFGRGRARLLETAPGRYVVRFEDFAVRNGPDLYVYLSPREDGYAKGAIELGRLRATDGSFNTKVPDGADVSKAKSVVIWCKQFSVLFAVARLEP
jgi:hypothetical protein